MFYSNITGRYKVVPSKSVVENDYALDRWIKEQQAKERSEMSQNSTKSKQDNRGPRDKDEFSSSQIIQ